LTMPERDLVKTGIEGLRTRGGEERTASGSLEMPADLYNGVALTLLKNLATLRPAWHRHRIGMLGSQRGARWGRLEGGEALRPRPSRGRPD